jgi:hypothetical protein
MLAGWHICFDVLDRFLVGKPIAAIAGVDAMKFAGWQRLVAEYSKQFGGQYTKLASFWGFVPTNAHVSTNGIVPGWAASRKRCDWRKFNYTD